MGVAESWEQGAVFVTVAGDKDQHSHRGNDGHPRTIDCSSENPFCPAVRWVPEFGAMLSLWFCKASHHGRWEGGSKQYV